MARQPRWAAPGDSWAVPQAGGPRCPPVVQSQPARSVCCSPSASPADLLIKETQRRNTFLLYAEAAATTAATAAAAAEEEEAEHEQPRAAEPAAQSAAPSVVGYIFYTATGLNAHISKLAVATEWRRRGIARALVRAAVQSATSERRVCSLSLHVDADNSAALGLYRGEGFETEALLEVGAMGCRACQWDCQLAGQMPACMPAAHPGSTRSATFATASPAGPLWPAGLLLPGAPRSQDAPRPSRQPVSRRVEARTHPRAFGISSSWSVSISQPARQLRHKQHGRGVRGD